MYIHNHHGRRPAIERFWEKVQRTDGGCWRWTGSIGGGGYGGFFWDGKAGYAHRFAYLTFIGPIPEGQELDHTCENTWCVNPDHVEPVKHGENIKRAYSREVVV